MRHDLRDHDVVDVLGHLDLGRLVDHCAGDALSLALRLDRLHSLRHQVLLLDRLQVLALARFLPGAFAPESIAPADRARQRSAAVGPWVRRPICAGRQLRLVAEQLLERLFPVLAAELADVFLDRFLGNAT